MEKKKARQKAKEKSKHSAQQPQHKIVATDPSHPSAEVGVGLIGINH